MKKILGFFAALLLFVQNIADLRVQQEIVSNGVVENKEKGDGQGTICRT